MSLYAVGTSTALNPVSIAEVYAIEKKHPS